MPPESASTRVELKNDVAACFEIRKMIRWYCIQSI